MDVLLCVVFMSILVFCLMVLSFCDFFEFGVGYVVFFIVNFWVGGGCFVDGG